MDWSKILPHTEDDFPASLEAALEYINDNAPGIVHIAYGLEGWPVIMTPETLGQFESQAEMHAFVAGLAVMLRHTISPLNVG